MIKQNFAKIIAYLSAAYGDKKMSSATADVYWDLLQDLPDDAVFAAVKQVAASNQYPTLPPVGVIRQAAVRLLCQLPSPAEAWAELTENIRQFGYYRANEGLIALSPIVRQAAKCIGYTEICLSENIEATRAHFLRAYEQYVAREKEQALMPSEVRRFVVLAAEKMQVMVEV